MNWWKKCVGISVFSFDRLFHEHVSIFSLIESILFHMVANLQPINLLREILHHIERQCVYYFTIIMVLLRQDSRGMPLSYATNLNKRESNVWIERKIDLKLRKYLQSAILASTFMGVVLIISSIMLSSQCIDLSHARPEFHCISFRWH